VAWFGRACAAIESWDQYKGPIVAHYLSYFGIPGTGGSSIMRFTMLLHQARHDLLAQLPASGSVAISGGMVFDYFDEVRKVIELAKQDLLFVDPYLDADFVSRYLPFVAVGVSIRLLAREKLATLLPAVDAFAQQTSRKIEVRSVAGFHDRYLLIDGVSCHQSGASFKDGAKKSPTTLTQILDAFPAVQKTYEDLWTHAQVHR
jgi:hypothetical protein